MYRVSDDLQQETWDNMLRMESMTKDPFEDFEGTFADNKEVLPDGIIANQAMAPGSHEHTIGLLKNLSGAGVTGRTDQIGQEQDQATQEVLVFANDVSQAVNTERYGIDANDKAAYKVLEKVQPQLSRWHKEISGKYNREALLERYSVNLTVAPISRTKRWNENWLVKNVALTAQPVYDSTNATYESNIATANTAGGSSADWDVQYLNTIIHWVTSVKKIEPMDNGRYIVLVPSRQAIPLKDPSASDSIGGLFKDSHIIEAATNSYKQYLGSYGILDLFEDPRAPVVDDDSGLSALYKGAGSDDDTGTASGDAYDIGFVMGKSALIKSTYEPLHFEEEIQNYKKVVGVGAFAGYGVTRLVYDDEGSETDASALNQNSGVLSARRVAIVS